MPIKKLQFTPTINKESTVYSAENTFRDCDKIRFRSGYPEKIGGWVKLNAQKFKGVCRALWAWRTLLGRELIGIGTNLKYYLDAGGELFDITPLRRTITRTNPLTTVTTTLALPLSADSLELSVASTANLPLSGVVQINAETIYYSSVNGLVLGGLIRGFRSTTPSAHLSGTSVRSAYILVSDALHGATTNSFVTFSGATSVGGVAAAAFNKEHQILLRDADSYYIDTGSFPTTSATGGGSVVMQYQINVGLALASGSEGWSAGGFGTGAYGIGVGAGASRQLRIWNNVNFGEDLVFGPKNEAIYYWDATNGLGSRAVLLSSLPGASAVPLFQSHLLVTESRFVVAFGTNPEGSVDFDPMLIRWSDQELPQVWSATATNLAGDLRVSLGSRIITAVPTRQEILVFTDTAVYSMQFLQTEEVFGITLLADNISIAGPNAVTSLNNVVYWMGKDKVYIYDGRVNTLPCTVRDFVFDNLNLDQTDQVYAGINPGFNEVWWFYADKNAVQNNRYFTWNAQDKAWAVGSMERTAWLYVARLGKPVAAFNDVLLQHETGNDDGAGEASVALPAYIESADIDIEDGDKFGFVRRVLPDITFMGSTDPSPTISMTLRPRNSSGGAYRAEESPMVVQGVTVPIEQFTEQVYIRARGRQMAVRIESSGMGVAWQMGMLRLDIREDGRKGG